MEWKAGSAVIGFNTSCLGHKMSQFLPSNVEQHIFSWVFSLLGAVSRLATGGKVAKRGSNIELSALPQPSNHYGRYYDVTT